MRGRKRAKDNSCVCDKSNLIKKESPNEGTETDASRLMTRLISAMIKKESPNEGTETSNFGMIIPTFLS